MSTGHKKLENKYRPDGDICHYRYQPWRTGRNCSLMFLDQVQAAG